MAGRHTGDTYNNRETLGICLESSGDTRDMLSIAGRHSGEAQNGWETLGRRSEWPEDTPGTLAQNGRETLGRRPEWPWDILQMAGRHSGDA